MTHSHFWTVKFVPTPIGEDEFVEVETPIEICFKSGQKTTLETNDFLVFADNLREALIHLPGDRQMESISYLISPANLGWCDHALLTDGMLSRLLGQLNYREVEDLLGMVEEVEVQENYLPPVLTTAGGVYIYPPTAVEVAAAATCYYISEKSDRGGCYPLDNLGEPDGWIEFVNNKIKRQSLTLNDLRVVKWYWVRLAKEETAAEN